MKKNYGAAAGRADLVRIYHQQGEAALDQTASFFGFQKKMDKKPEKSDKTPSQSGENSLDNQTSKNPAAGRGRDMRLMKFRHVTSHNLFDETIPVVTGTFDNEKPVSLEEEVFGPDTNSYCDLVLWQTIWPKIKKSFLKEGEGKKVDTNRIVSTISRGLPLNKIPFKSKGLLSDRAFCLLDFGKHLFPLWDDFIKLNGYISSLHSKENLKTIVIEEAGEDITFFLEQYVHTFDESGSIVVLSDLGLYSESARIRAQWENLGEVLVKKGISPIAFVPFSKTHGPREICGSWITYPVDFPFDCKNSILAAACPEDSKDAEYTELDMLLAHCSPALSVDWQLLRKLRIAFFPHSLCGLEIEAALHEDVEQFPTFFYIRAEKKHNRYYKIFTGFSHEEKEKAMDIITSYCSHYPTSVQAEQWIIYEGLNQESKRKEIKAAKDFNRRIARTNLKDPLSKDEFYINWFNSEANRLPKESWEQNGALCAAFAFVNKEALENKDYGILPGNLDLKLISPYLNLGEPEKKDYAVSYSENTLYIKSLEAGSGPINQDKVQKFCTISGQYKLLQVDKVKSSATQRNHYNLQKQVTIDCSELQEVTLTTELEQKTITTFTRPSWATRCGYDKYGLWAEFAIEDVIQRMRWIPPGTFQMGSPESEEGRYDDEVQHEVTLTKGYWLADTPCTQELWEKVMKENPAKFKSPQRPVELVSWDDSNKFLTRINSLIPGLELALPTEAQWEYACRAGTKTATYAGDLKIKGENNAPLLDPIAWYGGNCGRDFELENGNDISDWTDKQYKEDKKGGTHPVKQKLPNSWGLYDMLGNVLEWCQDMYKKDYPSERVIDPYNTESVSPVLRGGSWIRFARRVRSAYRYYRSRDRRIDYIGFRFSRG